MFVLNEPKTSLHPNLLIPLAELIIHAAQSSQIIVATHSKILTDIISAHTAILPINLIMTKHGSKLL